VLYRAAQTEVQRPAEGPSGLQLGTDYHIHV
jgi:hypothetical protein